MFLKNERFRCITVFLTLKRGLVRKLKSRGCFTHILIFLMEYYLISYIYWVQVSRLNDGFSFTNDLLL